MTKTNKVKLRRVTSSIFLSMKLQTNFKLCAFSIVTFLLFFPLDQKSDKTFVQRLAIENFVVSYTGKRHSFFFRSFVKRRNISTNFILLQSPLCRYWFFLFFFFFLSTIFKEKRKTLSIFIVKIGISTKFPAFTI